MIISTQNLVKTFTIGSSVVHALDGVNLEIPERDFVAVTGASGSGKTTLMNILGCLARPDSGKYILDGEDVSRLSKDKLAEIRNRRIGFVFQSFSLLSRTSALENVEMPLLYAGDKAAKQKAVKSLEIVGLADRMHHEPNQLSGGERQRVAIARALVTHPSIILADEPTGNLDSRTSDEILNIFEQLHRSGMTLLVVTHDPDVANRCQRVIRMRDGKIIEDKRKVSA
ncbi:MAG TPA: ABC transporter ATP-binding protein [Firmicutes bacterium]|nr:ABC transporter ATP-binding protein [Bacillota bacterium]